jgi:hypothetical protein
MISEVLEWTYKSIKLCLHNQVTLFFYDYLWLFMLRFVFFEGLLELKQERFCFLQLFLSILPQLLFLILFTLFLLFLHFLFVKLFASFFGTEHAFQVVVSLLLVEHNCCVLFTALVIIVSFFVSVLVIGSLLILLCHRFFEVVQFIINFIDI